MLYFINISCYTFYYLLIVLISFTIASNGYHRMKSQSGSFFGLGIPYLSAEKAKKKMGIGMILFLSILFVSLNFLVTKLSVAVGGDRQNYMLNFYGIRPSPSAGLTVIISVVRKFTQNVEWLWYVATLIVMTITLLGYRISQEATPKALLFFLTTQYVFTTFVNMKQCYANGLLSLCFVLALRNRGMRDRFFSVVLIFLAYLFHPTALIALPLCLIMWKEKSARSVFIFFIVLVVFLLTLKPLLSFIVPSLSSVAPSLSGKIEVYMAEMENEARATVSPTVVKGFPYYVITALACVKRHALKNKIRNYDNYLILSGALASIYMASFYNGWIYRLAYYLYLPIAIFYCQIMRFVRGWQKRLLLDLVVMGVISLVTIRYLIVIYLNYGGF